MLTTSLIETRLRLMTRGAAAADAGWRRPLPPPARAAATTGQAQRRLPAPGATPCRGD